MSQRIPIYIPTYINSAEYTPARVLPRLFFYNGQIECETWFIANENDATISQNTFPYFDNYNVVSGSFPTTDSKSLLFNNETVPYGEIPTENLYTEYWEKYISLLYNPYTRLINCDAIIPLADYFDMELNDVVNFRGNYYHLRAINDYSLKTGECKLQLLGPILSDVFDVEPVPPIEPANALIHLAEYNASPTAFFDANIIVDGTPYYFSGDFTQSIAGGTTGDVTMELKDGGATVWGPYTTASAQFSIYDNGTLLQSASLIVRSGSGDSDVSFPITFTSGHTFRISGSTAPEGTTTTTTTTTTTSGSFSNTVGYSSNDATVCSTPVSSFTMTGNASTFCTSTVFTGAGWASIASGTYYIAYGGQIQTVSHTLYSTTATVTGGGCTACPGSGTATLDWSFSVLGGPTTSYMYIYVNGSIIESRSSTSSGTYCVNVGDVIYVDLGCSGCAGGSSKANAYTSGIISDAACTTGTTTLSSYSYTVVSGDVGNVLHLDSFSICETGCL